MTSTNRPTGAALSFAHASDRGRVRRTNEDTVDAFTPDDPVRVRTHGSLFLVADGISGTGAGRIASRLAVETIRDRFYDGTHGETRAEALTESVKAANAMLFRARHQEGVRLELRTTLTALVLHGSEAIVGHVGDSRAYLVRRGRIHQMTEDHSLVRELVRQGVIDQADAVNHPQSHIVLRALGAAPAVQADIQGSVPLRAGDAWILCTDGLSGAVSAAEMCDLAVKYPPDQACQRLVALAMARGGSDNITVQIIKVGKRPRTSSRGAILTAALVHCVERILTSVTCFRRVRAKAASTPTGARASRRSP